MAQGTHPGWTLSELAAEVGGSLVSGDPQARILRGLPGGVSDPEGFCFARDARFLAKVPDGVGVALAPVGSGLQTFPTIEVSVPELAYYTLLGRLVRTVAIAEGVDPRAAVSPEAEIHTTARVGPFAVVEAGARVGPRCRVHAFAYVGEGCVMEEDCVLLPHAVLLQNVTLLARTTVFAGAVLGTDGFGFVEVGGVQRKKPQVGGVTVGPDAEVGANSTVDRATTGETVLGEGVKLDNLVQIGHNVTVGRHTVVAAQTGLGGSSRIGEWVTLGGQSGVADHAVVVDRVSLGGQTGVVGSGVFEPGGYFGTPATPYRQSLRQGFALRELPALLRRVAELEKRLQTLEGQ